MADTQHNSQQHARRRRFCSECDASNMCFTYPLGTVSLPSSNHCRWWAAWRKQRASGKDSAVPWLPGLHSPKYEDVPRWVPMWVLQSILEDMVARWTKMNQNG